MSMMMLTECFRDLYDACQPHNPLSFYNRIDFSEVSNWDVIYNFDNGFSKGKGSFGEVRGKQLGPTLLVAIKKILRATFDVKEVNCMHDMVHSLFIPKFYGCQYTNTEVYIVQSYFENSLADETWLNFYRKWKPSEKIRFSIQIVSGLRDMWSIGLVHNDIKADNIMTDGMNAFLIDFGLASSVYNNLPIAGSTFYMSFSYPVPRPSPFDDLYAVALTIAQMEEQNGWTDFFTDTSNGRKDFLPNKYSKYLPYPDFIEVYARNAAILLERAGFGLYKREIVRVNDPNINFTTLIVILIKSQDKLVSHYTLVDILENLKAKEVEKENDSSQYGSQNQKTARNFQLSNEDRQAFERFYAEHGFTFDENETEDIQLTPADFSRMTLAQIEKYWTSKRAFRSKWRYLTADFIRENEKKRGLNRYYHAQNYRNLLAKDKLLII